MRPDDAEVARLRRELAKTKAECDILKKGHRLLREGTTVKFEFIAKHRGVWRTRDLCEALGVSRGGIYEWLRRPPSGRRRENLQLQARRRRRRLPSDIGIRPASPIAPNLLDRQFEATAPNRRWVADFTYIWTHEG
jgi:putative transposase